MRENRPRVVLGTMTIGGQMNEKDGEAFIRRFLDSGHNELDTAFIYQAGRTEEILGRILKGVDRGRFRVATKAHPRAEGNLKKESVIRQLDTSLTRLGVDRVDLFYLHMPDPKTDFADTLDGLEKLHGQNKFVEWGLSNYAAWEVVHIRHLCGERNLPVPAVYQGMYNPITRSVEDPELLPCAQALGFRFYAYNPMAGGFLSGKHKSFEQIPDAGRFSGNPQYQERYWKKSSFEALERLRRACNEEGIPMAAAALRWMMHHSRLTAKDGVIIGASRMAHLEANLQACAAPELPETVVAGFTEAWEITRSSCPAYARYFGREIPAL